jgi:hypothetical protein
MIHNMSELSYKVRHDDEDDIVGSPPAKIRLPNWSYKTASSGGRIQPLSVVVVQSWPQPQPPAPAPAPQPLLPTLATETVLQTAVPKSSITATSTTTGRVYEVGDTGAKTTDGDKGHVVFLPDNTPKRKGLPRTNFNAIAATAGKIMDLPMSVMALRRDMEENDPDSRIPDPASIAAVKNLCAYAYHVYDLSPAPMVLDVTVREKCSTWKGFAEYIRNDVPYLSAEWKHLHKMFMTPSGIAAALGLTNRSIASAWYDRIHGCDDDINGNVTVDATAVVAPRATPSPYTLPVTRTLGAKPFWKGEYRMARGLTLEDIHRDIYCAVMNGASTSSGNLQIDSTIMVAATTTSTTTTATAATAATTTTTISNAVMITQTGSEIHPKERWFMRTVDGFVTRVSDGKLLRLLEMKAPHASGKASTVVSQEHMAQVQFTLWQEDDSITEEDYSSLWINDNNFDESEIVVTRVRRCNKYVEAALPQLIHFVRASLTRTDPRPQSPVHLPEPKTRIVATVSNVLALIPDGHERVSNALATARRMACEAVNK